MNIEQFKALIESKNLPEHIIIMKLLDSNFIANQYINFIKTFSDINYIDNYTQLSNDFDIFGADNTLNVLKQDVFECSDINLKNKRLIVICKKIEKSTAELFSDYIVEIPKLESWQLYDYASSLAEGLDKKSVEYLLNLCNNDIYRLDKELQKIIIFDKNAQQFIFNYLIDDNAFGDLSSKSVFDFTNCIIRKDIQSLFNLYKEIENIDIEPIGLPTILIKNFKDIIDVQLSVNSSPEALNMNSKKYWAIRKYSCGYYTKDQLIFIYRFLTDIDRKVKTGELPVNMLIDYIVTKVFICA